MGLCTASTLFANSTWHKACVGGTFGQLLQAVPTSPGSLLFALQKHLATHRQPQAFPSDKPLETQFPYMKVFFLIRHLHFTSTSYFQGTFKLSTHNDGIAFIFVWISCRLLGYLVQIWLGATHSSRACQKISLAAILPRRMKSVDLRSRRKLSAPGLALPCCIPFLLPSATVMVICICWALVMT